MAWTIDPTCDGALHCVGLSIVVGHILREATLEKWHFLTSDVETRVADRYFPICHRDAVLKRDIMESLVPGERRQLVPRPELIC